jgi:hypothetical protein
VASAHHNFGSVGGLTDRERHAVQKMAAEVHMAQVDDAPHMSTLLRMAMLAPNRFRQAMKKSTTFRVVCDSGASMSVTNVRDDLVGPIEKPSLMLQLKGSPKVCASKALVM